MNLINPQLAIIRPSRAKTPEELAAILEQWYETLNKLNEKLSQGKVMGTELLIGSEELGISINPDFTFELHGNATVFEDLQISISNVRVPPAQAPTERFYNHGIVGGVTFPVLGFDVNEHIYFDLQTSHSMKLNTILDSHMHFMTPTDGSTDRFQFQLDVISAPIGGNWIVPTGSPFTTEHLIDDDYSNSHILQEIADIPAINSTVSTLYKCKLTRIAASADEYGGEVYIEFTDSHYEKNGMGSATEDAK